MTFNFAQKNRNMRILKFIVTFILLMGSVSNSLAQVSSGRLKDKVAIVTGAASGNGKEDCRHVATKPIGRYTG